MTHAMPVMIDMIRRSPVSAEIAYVMSKDFWAPNSLGTYRSGQVACR